ncbi:transcription factor bHLH68-like isoform X2 [Miscanthus floridulus]|uniref:transcription factor bHLH68-like isoform X2 n=1 Tax=Miscanthus floridulus TaxID=154761 RepID=UPI003457C7D1
MDRGVVHKSSAALVREMGEAGHGHGWWSINNLMGPPFEQQHHPSLFMPSTTTTTTTTGTAAAAVPSPSSSSALHSFSSLLLSNHYPLPTTTSTSPPWQHDSSTTSSHGQQDSWIQLLQGGLSNTSSTESQMAFPSTICSEAGGSSGSYVVYGAAAASGYGSSTSDVEIQFPWGSSSVLQQNSKQQASQQQKPSSPRSSSITTTTTSLGSNMLEFSNNSSSSPRECISTASGSAFKKARTQEPSPAQSTVKVRKEKLGDRITALHQLVSPFGKTDTASVLLEAIGYIRFLHGQIEALSSPYVGGSNGGGGGSKHQQQLHEASVHGGERHSIFPEDPGQDESCEEAKKDLRSRGLCLVPVSCTLDVGDVVAGPGDYWAAAAPAFGMGFGG